MYLQRAAVFASRRISFSEIVCLYPLDATEAEILALGFGLDAKLTMSGANQTFLYPVDGSLASTRSYGAAPDGISTGTAEKIDFSTGTVAFEFGAFDMLTSGVDIDSGAGLGPAILDAAVTSLWSPATMGGWVVPSATGPYTGHQGVPVFAFSNGIYIYMLSATSSMGVYFDSAAGQYGVTLKDADRYDTTKPTPYTPELNWSGDLGLIGPYTPGLGSLVVGVTEDASSGAAGDCGATLRTDARDMQCLYPEGTKDKCGALVDNFSLIESATLTRATPATRWTSAQLLEEVAADTLRLDHDPATGAVRGRLVEAGATRDNPDVTDLSATSSWTSVPGLSVTSVGSVLTGEDAWRFDNDGSSGSRSLYYSGLVPSFKVYQKAIIENIDATETAIGVQDTTDGGFIAFAKLDWSTGSTSFGVASAGTGQTSSAKKLLDTGPNGGSVYEVTVTGTPDNPGNDQRLRCYPTGIGTNTESAIVHAIQYGESPSSSIILGNGSSATRDPDILAATFTKTSGTLHIEGEHIGGDGVLWQADDGTENNRVRFEVSSGNIVMTVTDGGTEQAAITAGALASDGTYNFAARFAKNDFAISIDGATAVTDTTGTVPTLTTDRFGGDTTGVTGRNWYKRTDYRDESFTDAQLEALSA